MNIAISKLDQFSVGALFSTAGYFLLERLFLNGKVIFKGKGYF